MISRRRLAPISLALFLCFTVVASLPAQEKSLKPGINENYKKQDIDQAVARFENERRAAVKTQAQILAACQLKPGLVVADVGAGTGLFTRPFAEKVAPGGEVFAVDVTERFVEHINKTCKEQGIDNVVGVLSSPASTGLSEESVDIVFTCDTYHHFEYPYKMLASIRATLRASGILIVVDRKKASEHVRAGQETVKKEVTDAGFTLLDEEDLADDQYLMRFQKKRS